MNANLVEVFKDTRNLYTTNPYLISSCKYSENHQEIYKAGISFNCNYTKYPNDANVIVSPKRTFEAAKPYAKSNQRVAVLNFANSFTPGGGVIHGARAQEESLCRISTLYYSLTSPETYTNFYKPHLESFDDLGTDDLIYTPEITVFKSDTEQPSLLSEDDWFNVDVITCAAPCITMGTGMISEKHLIELHTSRARQILDAACYKNVEVVILGAFGCGAFCNPPEIVAEVYKQVIQQYKKAFRTIEFAIYCKDTKTENFNVFSRILGAN